MKIKKGFTLIELLGVIVIMGFIAVISVPIVSKYTLDAKKDSFEETLKIVTRASKVYFSNKNIRQNLAVDLTTNEIKFSGNKLEEGVVVGSRDDLKVYIYDDGYCGYSDGNNYVVEKASKEQCGWNVNDTIEVVETNKIAKEKTIKGYRVYGETDNNGDSLGETSNSITIKVRGKNLLDKRQFKIAGLQNEIGFSAWGMAALDNEWILNNLKPNTKYTVSFDSKCTAIPEHDTSTSGSIGFLIYSGKKDENGNNFPSIWLNKIVDKILTLEEKFSSPKTITTPATLHSPLAAYKIAVYTNAYKKNNKSVYGIIEYKNVQIEEGSAATSYEPYFEPKEYTIELSAPLRKYGEAVDYIDSSLNQVVRNVGVNDDGTFYILDKPIYEQIELPKISNSEGNIIVEIINTNMDPSKVEFLLDK